MSGRRYEGPPLDGTVQYITERPELDEQADEVDYATQPEPDGEEQTENVPELEQPDRSDPDNVDGQTTLEDWGWSA